MRFEPDFRTLLSVSSPIIIAGISESIIDIVDTIFLAHYGTTQLAAVGLAVAIYGLAMFVAIGLIDGLQIIIGRRVGEGEDKAVGLVFNHALILLAATSAVLIALTLVCLPYVTSSLLYSEAIHTEVNAYLRITIFGLLFQSFNMAYSVFLVGISRTGVLVRATLVLAVTNIVVDYLLIFGNLGLPELGITGAAIASLAAEIMTFLVFCHDVYRKGYMRTYNLFRPFRWSRNLTRRLVAISSPVSMEALVETGKWFLFFIVVERLGEQVMGMASIIFSCYGLLLIPVESFGESACSMASNLVGQGRGAELSTLVRRTVLLTYLAVIPVVLVGAFFPEILLGIFSSDLAWVPACRNALRVTVLAVFIAVPAEAAYSVLVGTGHTRGALGISVIMSLIALITVWITGYHLRLELHYIWTAEVFGWLVCFVLSCILLRRGGWRRLEI